MAGASKNKAGEYYLTFFQTKTASGFEAVFVFCTRQNFSLPTLNFFEILVGEKFRRVNLFARCSRSSGRALGFLNLEIHPRIILNAYDAEE